MLLKDWITGNVERFRQIVITTAAGVDYIYSDTDYDDLVKKNGDEPLYSCFAVTRSTHYLFYNKETQKAWTISFKDTMTDSHTRFFYGELFGNAYWYEKLETKYPGILGDCVGCKCLNDKLVTGWCEDKSEGLKIKEGFID